MKGSNMKKKSVPVDFDFNFSADDVKFATDDIVFDFPDLNFGTDKTKINAPKTIGENEKSISALCSDVSEDLKDTDKFIKDYKERAKSAQKSIDDDNNGEYYFCVYFPTREQKLDFMQKLKINNFDEFFLDGLELAKHLGLSLESESKRDIKEFKVKKDYADLV